MGPDQEQALTLRRAERIQKHGNKKEKGADEVLSGNVLIREKVSFLSQKAATQQDLEEHTKTQLCDPENTPLGSPEHVPRLTEPVFRFDTAPPKWSEINLVVNKAALTPGPNGMPHKVYKNCPMVLKLLWKLTRIAWKSQAIPSEYSQAVATFTPQEATTSWHQLGKGIAMGCSTSPILSTTAFNILLIGSQLTTSRSSFQAGQLFDFSFYSNVTQQSTLQQSNCKSYLLLEISNLSQDCTGVFNGLD